MALDPQRQRLEPLQEQERVERRERRAEVAQQLDAQPDDERRRSPNTSEKTRPWYAGSGSVNSGKRGALRRPVEAAAVDDDAADRRAVAADPLGGRVDDDVGAVLDRAARGGGANVLSTTSGTPAACATSASASKSGTSSCGLPIVST